MSQSKQAVSQSGSYFNASKISGRCQMAETEGPVEIDRADRVHVSSVPSECHHRRRRHHRRPRHHP